MNLKFIVVSIGLFLVLISNGIEHTENKKNNQNELSVSRQNVVQEEEIQKDNVSSLDDIIEIDNTKEKEEVKIEIDEKHEEIKDNDKNTKVIEPKTNVQNKEISQKNNKQENKTEIKEEQEVNIEQTENNSKELTPDDLEYWCIAGGSHHVAGDGENEHGYYTSWNEAYNAFLNYTADWSSSQYKVDCCSCGLYYFWAIK